MRKTLQVPEYLHTLHAVQSSAPHRTRSLQASLNNVASIVNLRKLRLATPLVTKVLSSTECTRLAEYVSQSLLNNCILAMQSATNNHLADSFSLIKHCGSDLRLLAI